MKLTGSREEAVQLDAASESECLRRDFIVPQRSQIASASTQYDGKKFDDGDCVYLCGNSLGLQPKRTRERVEAHLSAWAELGVKGHFKTQPGSGLTGFVQLDEQAAKMMAPLVGAREEEVAIMETLTANIHLMMAAFYRPRSLRRKIMIESKAFPSDQFAVVSQLQHHDFDAQKELICLEPDSADSLLISTAGILRAIDEHKDTLALILLPGVQYYTGQAFEMARITAYARQRGITIGWDMAHAVGNIPLSLHDWDVDFAVWCNYKYMNSGPGAVAGAFIHERHGNIVNGKYHPRLAGWWGGDKSIRFQMKPEFIPIKGAQGFQVGNPSSLAVTALIASLEIFQATSMSALRMRSKALTAYLEELLKRSQESILGKPSFKIITPSDPEQRGAQLSLLLAPNILDEVMCKLETAGVVVDERKPDVIRVAPAPLYNTYLDVWKFVQIFCDACSCAQHISSAYTG